MGHKKHPISLRLHTNRSFDAAWFTDTKYSEFVAYDMHLRAYLRALFQCANLLPARILSHAFAGHRTQYALFAHMPEMQTRRADQAPFALFHEHQPRTAAARFVSKNTLSKARFALVSWHAQRQAVYTQDYVRTVTTQLSPVQDLQRVQSAIVARTHVRALDRLYVPNPYRSHIEASLSTCTNTPTTVYPLRLSRIFQSAESLSAYIANLVEQKKSFRMIWKTILALLSHESRAHKNGIQGLRVVLSGRLNGVEIARVESKRWGRTSLHVFADKIDYASATAYTVYGLIGVKVWVCYS